MNSLVDKMNKRILNAQPSNILKFNQKISSIPNLIHLTLGEPDFNTPDHIKKAAINAIKNNDSHYTNSRGILPLRKNAANFLKQKYNINYNPETQILVTSGVTEGIRSTFNAILNPDDKVIIPSPMFGLYVAGIKLNGAEPVFVDTSQSNYKLTPEKLETTIKQNENVKAVILNYPTNPTGITYNSKELRNFANIIKKYDLFCISDEIYSELSYTHNHISMGSILPQNTILFNGVSKSHAMTGYRIGLICGPTDIISKINIDHQTNITSATTVAQYAANEAFKNGLNDSQNMRIEYEKRLKILRDGLNEVGFDSPKPSGAFYIFAKIPKQFNQNSFKFAYQLAKEAHVGTIPGAAFGPGGEGHLRISYAASRNDINESVQRIQSFIKKHK